MSLSRSNFDAICEMDLIECVNGSMPESLDLDYKQDTYGNSDSDKRELLKDVSAFANANGGHIVIGMLETNGVASKLCGINVSNIDNEVLRIDQIIRTGIEPRIPSCRVKAIPLSSQKSQAIVIRIPKSWRLPHRVCAKNANTYWIRNSAGKHEASMDELRNLFTLSASTIERANSFHIERIQHLKKKTGTRPLVGNGRFIFHIIPLSAVSSTLAIDSKSIYDEHQAFRPLGSMGMSPRFNLEGVINERGGEMNHGYTQIYRTGIVEAVKANLIKYTKDISALNIEKYFFEALPNYINGLKKLNFDPPFIIMLALEGVIGAYYRVIDDSIHDKLIPFDRDIVPLPDCTIEEFGTDADYHSAMKPAFDTLWNAVGYTESLYFDKNTGLWIGR